MPRRNSSFGGSFDSSFVNNFSAEVRRSAGYELGDDTNPFDFEPPGRQLSRIRFYNVDSAWARWRRGYELYTMMQTIFGTSNVDRRQRGDFRLYSIFQQQPGRFVPARIFTYPSGQDESNQQFVVTRDPNSLNFYDYFAQTKGPSYKGNPQNGSVIYSTVGIDKVADVTLENHGYFPGDSVEIYQEDPLTPGFGPRYIVDVETANWTQNSFRGIVTFFDPFATFTDGSAVLRYQTFNYENPHWTQMWVAVTTLPAEDQFLINERFTDRCYEADSGIAGCTYTINVTTKIVTVVTPSPHGLFTGSKAKLEGPVDGIGSINVVVTVVNPTTLTFIIPVVPTNTSDFCILFRPSPQFDYDNYVGFTAIGTFRSQNIDVPDDIIFQREGSYGVQVINGERQLVTPAHRGFEAFIASDKMPSGTRDSYLTSEIRYQCSCQDYLRRNEYNLYSRHRSERFPNTPIGDIRPGNRILRDGQLSDERDNVGVFSDFGYLAINDFNQIPTYDDTVSNPGVQYYQMRWCKHLYATFWSLVHDEGNRTFSLEGTFTQVASNNITVTLQEDHNLEVNDKVNFVEQSGNIDGEYIVLSVTNSRTVILSFPYVRTISGYCTLRNIRRHTYLRQWLTEPTDPPIGAALDDFYIRLRQTTETSRVQGERWAMLRMGVPWSGTATAVNRNGLPVLTSNFDTNIVTMILNDTLRRGENNELDRQGVDVNTTQRLLDILTKVCNLAPQFLQDTKFGLVDEPAYDYTDEFALAQVLGSTYRNGLPIIDSIAITVIDCDTYTPYVNQVNVLDGGTY